MGARQHPVVLNVPNRVVYSPHDYPASDWPLSAPSTQTVTVAYSTADGTATADNDYVAANGTLTFAPGQTQATVSVTVLYDPTLTHDATFYVLLADPTHSTLDGNAQGTGTIRAGA